MLTAHQTKGLRIQHRLYAGTYDEFLGEKTSYRSASASNRNCLRLNPSRSRMICRGRGTPLIFRRCDSCETWTLSFISDVCRGVKKYAPFYIHTRSRDGAYHGKWYRTFFCRRESSQERCDARRYDAAEEEEYIREFFSTYKLSATDLNKFLSDPLVFLRDTIFRYPFEENEHTIFGKTYHKALEIFYATYKNTGEAPSKSWLNSQFQRFSSLVRFFQ